MARNIIETIMGAVVLLVAGGFLVFAFQKSAVKDVNGYHIKARFSDVSGIGLGSDVRIGGMKVGVVQAIELDPKTYQAEVSFEIRDEIELPKDSSAAVVSSGLLGDKFIKLEPGGAEEMLEDDGEIRFTQSSVSFEELIGKFVFSDGGVSNNSGSDSGSRGSSAKSGDDASENSDADGEKKTNPFSLGL